MNFKNSLFFLIIAMICCTVHAASNPASTEYVAAKIATLEMEIKAMLNDNTG